MGQLKGKLYVADIDEVVVVDIKSGKVLEKIKVPDASFLNDITVDKKGNVYVSDSNTKKVHRISGGKVSVYHETPTKPNGLLILDSGTLLKVDAQKKVTTLVTDLDKSTDGIEEVKPGEYIVSCWSGVIYYVKADGSKQELLNTSEQKVNSADIGYDAKKRIVYVPTFFKNSVAAYHLK
jgi:DNA-binding beta-propeller fold protein YncE